MRDAIVLARAGARERGVTRLSAEAESIGIELGVSRLESEFARDWLRAVRVSRSYTNRWLDKAVELENPRAASATTQGSLERIGVTESSEAFTTGRRATLEVADLRAYGGTDRVVSEMSLMRAWDSALEKNTCATCASADGTIVGINESFPAGEPGSVHPRCLCGFSLVRVNFRG